MQVRLAPVHKQRRLSDPELICDNCAGLKLQNDPVPITVDPDPAVVRYYILVPGMGNQLFDLHPKCADDLAA